MGRTNSGSSSATEGSDQATNLLGSFGPAIRLRGLSHRLGHGGECDSPTVNSGRKVGTKPRERRNRRVLFRILIRTLNGDTVPSWAVVMPRVVGAESLDKPRSASIPIAHEPIVPSRTRVIGGVQKFIVAAGSGKFPGCCGNGNDHLNLPKARLRYFVVRGKLSVGALKCEENKVTVARDVGPEFPVHQRFMWSTLQPDARVVRALNQHGLVVARQNLDIRGKNRKGAIVRRLPA
jgi:hypothetical protein